MNLISRPALALLLGSLATVSLSGCDYDYTPGKNNVRTGFTNPPGWRNSDVNRDSINGEQKVYTPIGKGSATAIRTGGVDAQLQSAPAGSGTGTEQNANGKLSSVNQNTTTNPDGNNADQGNKTQGMGE